MTFEYIPWMWLIKVTLEDGEATTVSGLVADLWDSAELDFVDYHGIEYFGNHYPVYVLEYANGGMVYVNGGDVEVLNEDRVLWLDVIKA